MYVFMIDIKLRNQGKEICTKHQGMEMLGISCRLSQGISGKRERTLVRHSCAYIRECAKNGCANCEETRPECLYRGMNDMAHDIRRSVFFPNWAFKCKSSQSTGLILDWAVAQTARVAQLF